MPNASLPMAYGLMAVAVLVLIFGIRALSGGGGGETKKKLNRRLSLIAEHGDDSRAAYEQLRRHSISEGASPWLARILESRWIHALDNLVLSSGVTISTQRVMLYSTAGFVLVFLGLDFLGLGFVARLVCSAVLAIGLPLGLLRVIRRRRLDKLVAQLPDAVEMLVRSLRAGHPVMTGINLVAQEMMDPIGTEFGLVFDEMSYGLDIREALEKLADRLRLLEIDYMIVAIRVQQGTGGSLAEILTSFAGVMRQRQLLHAKVKALSAEARLSGKVLGGLPVLVVGALILMNPHYYDEAQTDANLRFVLGSAAFLALIGILLLRRFTDIKV